MKQAVLLVLVTLAAYLPTFGGAFQFDDYNVIVDHPPVQSWQAFFDTAPGGIRPVLKASYTLNWTLNSGTFGFHLVNVVLHALNATLLFFIGRRLTAAWTAGPAPAFVAALLFALHPAQTEAVTYISGRSVSLMASFYLGALLLYLRGSHTLLALALFLLALATRETAVTLPAVMLLCVLSTCARPEWRPLLRRQAPYWIVLAAAGLVVLVHERYFNLLAYGYSQRTLADNVLSQIGGVSYLITRVVTLRGYNIDPALPVVSTWTALLALQALLLASLLALGLLSLRRRPWLAFGILWFFLQVAPTNSLVPRLDIANDRQLYLACWGLFLALGVQVARLQPPRTAALALAGALFALFAMANIARQLDYRDEITLWQASVRESPHNARARNNLGYAYYLAGRQSEARREFETAVQLDRGWAKPRANLLFLEWSQRRRR